MVLHPVRRSGCGFVPTYLLERVLVEAASSSLDAEAYRETLQHDAEFRAERQTRALLPEPPLPPLSAGWTVHSADQGTRLPGRVVRRTDDPPSGDLAVDEAALGITGSLALFAEVYDRDSFDGSGAPVSLTVHFGRSYNNAFWNGTQLVFGDGDGRVFERFTKPVDVLGHEFTHAVTERSAGLIYRDQSGALNESMSDVFASCLKQRLLGQSADQGDWLIGEGLFRPGINARGLRDMAAPGTAYDDPVLGRDPQPAHMDDYIDTTDDNGGVHLNSGIPNRAFYLTALAIGGTSWEGAGRVWYAALTSDLVGPRSDFAAFAAATVTLAGSHAEAVRGAWAQVGVTPPVEGRAGSRGATGAAVMGLPGDLAGARAVRVRRSGGFAGITTDGEVDLTGSDPRAAEVRALLSEVDLRAAQLGDPHPDMFVYAFSVDGGADVRVPEQHLTGSLRRLADLVLQPPEAAPEADLS